ncbi:MAG: DHH family phosphoesterase, partial [Candidatus Gracilibacteria bacterium]|nr:DHH family phosphoesterase [Candidatus Gracilibacteria bacterium]
NKLYNIIYKYQKNNLDKFGGDIYKDKESVFLGMFEKLKKFDNLEKFFLNIDRIIKNKEGIIITGDYDADGIGSTVMFADFLDMLNIPYKVRLPEREKDGYGIREDNLNDLLNYSLGSDGFNNVVALDNGVNQIGVYNNLKELGYNFFIIDHHGEDEDLIKNNISQTHFQLNPHLIENKEKILTDESNMCTGQLVYMFCLGYLKTRGKNDIAGLFSKIEVDMLLTTTICDMMPLTGLNRGIVKHFKNDFLYQGKFLRKSMKKMLNDGLDGPFIQIDPENSKINNIETFIGWTVGPNINALGRIDKPINAFHFIRNSGVEYEYVLENNEKRKKLTKLIKEEIFLNNKEELENPSQNYFLYKGG